MENLGRPNKEATQYEKVQYWLRESIYNLRSFFGIENLSNNELFILKKITEDVVEKLEYNNENNTDLGLINPDKEIPQRFLLEAYGIDFYHIHSNTKTDEDEDGFIEYIRRIRERAHLI